MEAQRYTVNNLFNRRHANYYPAMAKLVAHQAMARRGNFSNESIVDVGCGIGVSTYELAAHTAARTIFAVDKAKEMLAVCRDGFLGEPRVAVLEGNAENLDQLVPEQVYGIFCIQMIHLLHPNQETSKVPQAITAFSKVLMAGGVLAVDFGPSNGDFRKFKLADHRSGRVGEDEIMTELAHPLYQEVMGRLPGFAKRYGFAIESFWPPAATRFKRNLIDPLLQKAGFGDIRVIEGLYPMRGEDVWNHIYLNLWTVAKRWLPSSGLSNEQFFKMIEEAVLEIRSDRRFDEMVSVSAFHPYQILTAVRS